MNTNDNAPGLSRQSERTGREPELSGQKPFCDICQIRRSYSWVMYDLDDYVYWICGDCFVGVNTSQIPIPVHRPSSMDSTPIPPRALKEARPRTK